MNRVDSASSPRNEEEEEDEDEEEEEEEISVFRIDCEASCSLYRISPPTFTNRITTPKEKVENTK